MKKLFFIIALCMPLLDVAAQRKKISGITLAKADSLFNAGKWNDAIAAYEVVLKDPAASAVANTWLNAGVSHLNAGSYDKALAAFGKAGAINPRLPLLPLYIARASSASGQVDKAIAALDSARGLGFGNYKLVEREPYFSNLRNDPRWTALRSRLVEPSSPCLRIPEARQFDFWLGDWDVFLTSNLNARTGFNRITRSSGGCVIEENWEAATGPHVGMSINYYDPSDSTWKQKWAGSSQDITEFYDGVYKDGAMRFKYKPAPRNGVPMMGRLTFTNISPGRVRQHAQQSADGGQTWTDVYDFTYVRRDGTAPEHP